MLLLADEWDFKRIFQILDPLGLGGLNELEYDCRVPISDNPFSSYSEPYDF